MAKKLLRARLAEQQSNFTDSAQSAQGKRNAQNLSSVCSAGHDFRAGARNVSTVIERLIKGAKVNAGAFDGTYFGIPRMSVEEAKKASQHLVLKDGLLQYDPSKKPVNDTESADLVLAAAQDIVLACARVKAFSGDDRARSNIDSARVLDLLGEEIVVEGESFGFPLTENERKQALPFLTIDQGVLKIIYKGKMEDPTPIAGEMFAQYQKLPTPTETHQEGSRKARRNA
ncbi:MAG: hypothetical protein L7V86_25440 [Verrucomicrobiales bacterium]|jgi:hypothetical protein|nr:hypothetical protein [Verrucomicrobiales bacterium]MDA7644188.1 hypothetical protein [Verrucomicrobiales bacterium]MDF1784855.1 hypothetical protein [Verrucomicrobiales bacterium]